MASSQGLVIRDGAGEAGPFEIPTDLLIGDRWRAAASGRRIDVINPSTGEVIGSVADASVDEALSAVEAAYNAGPAWAATPPRVRAGILMQCFERMMAHADWLAYVIALESGKSLTDARGEVAYAAEFFRWYAEEAVRINGELAVAPAGANKILVQYQPIGVSVLITPWNFPAAMATRKMGPALAAGCTCILKPAKETPFTALAIAQIMREAGVPAGVVNLLNTSEPGPVVRAIVRDPRVRKLSFTGSTQVGRTLLHECADHVVSASMELGGNAPFLVLDDADIDAAVDGAMIAKMRNGGEACTAANRIYVQRGAYDAFVTKFAERMGALRVGDGTSPETQLGAMINAAAIDKISSLVEDAKSRGARVVVGGAAMQRPGYFYPPTVLADVHPDSEMLQTEVFGPVAPIVPFDDIEEAIALANGTEYGLAAYLYTKDLKKGLALSERIEAGMVALNRGLVSDPAAPFGGVKQSGLGREGSHHGMHEYLEAKYIAVSW